jgi:hypothetical protein
LGIVHSSNGNGARGKGEIIKTTFRVVEKMKLVSDKHLK